MSSPVNSSSSNPIVTSLLSDALKAEKASRISLSEVRASKVAFEALRPSSEPIAIPQSPQSTLETFDKAFASRLELGDEWWVGSPPTHSLRASKAAMLDLQKQFGSKKPLEKSNASHSSTAAEASHLSTAPEDLKRSRSQSAPSEMGHFTSDVDASKAAALAGGIDEDSLEAQIQDLMFSGASRAAAMFKKSSNDFSSVPVRKGFHPADTNLDKKPPDA